MTSPLAPDSCLLVSADFAQSMAALGVQLVKYILCPADRRIWPAEGARRLGHFRSGGVMHGGRLRQAILSRHRNRPGFGAGHLPWPWSPGRSPERSRDHRREHDDGQRNPRRQPVSHGAPLSCGLRSSAVLPCLAGLPRHLRRYGRRRLAASAWQTNFRRCRTPCGVRLRPCHRQRLSVCLREEPVRLTRVSALARTTSGSRGSVGRSSAPRS